MRIKAIYVVNATAEGKIVTRLPRDEEELAAQRKTKLEGKDGWKAAIDWVNGKDEDLEECPPGPGGGGKGKERLNNTRHVASRRIASHLILSHRIASYPSLESWNVFLYFSGHEAIDDKFDLRLDRGEVPVRRSPLHRGLAPYRRRSGWQGPER